MSLKLCIVCVYQQKSKQTEVASQGKGKQACMNGDYSKIEANTNKSTDMSASAYLMAHNGPLLFA